MEEKRQFLLNLVKEIYPQGDNFYANPTNKGNKWQFGYINDYPLQHGDGESMILPDRVVSYLMLKK